MEENKITETGIGGLKGIRGEDLYGSVTDEQLLNIGRNARNSNYNAMHGHIGYDALDNPALLRPQTVDPNTQIGQLGSSRYDEIMVLPSPEEIGDYRAVNLPWYDKLGAGVLKGTALAGTTFLDGVGLLYGVGSAIMNQDEGEIFNNKLSTSLREFNQYMEETLPVYRTLDEIENPMALRNLFSMSTIADDFIKNMGFTVGAFYSGGAYLKALLSVGNLVKAGKMSATAAKVIGSTVSGINEGRIEAGNLYDEKVKNDISTLQETYKPLVTSIMNEPDSFIEIDGVMVNQKLERLKQLQQRYLDLEEAIKLRATSAAMMDLIFNSIYLPIDDYFTYGKLYARKSNFGKDLANKVGRSVKADDIAEQVAKEEVFGDRIVRDAAGKYVAKPISKGKSAVKGLNIFAREGAEEMNQAMFESTATNYYTPDSPDAYYQALTNDNYEAKTKDFMTSLTQGIKDSWGKGDTYKEFIIGGLNGIIGMPTFGKVNNSDHNTWLGRGNLLAMSGGMFGEMSNDSYYNQLAQEASLSMNAFIDKVNNSKMFFTRSQSFDNAMDGYSELDDKYEFLNAKDNDLFNVIDAYSRTGRILDLYDLVNQDFEDLSEERLREIAQDTESSTNEWRNVDGTLMSDSEEGREEMSKKLLDRRKSIIEGIKSYEKALQRARTIANNSLTEDLVAELAWLAWKQDKFTDRFNEIKEQYAPFIDKLSNATKAFLRGRGLGQLVLSPEQAALEVEEFDDKGNIISSRKKTEEEILNEVTIGLGIKHSMEVVSLFLNAINDTESPLQLSYFVKNNPQILQFIDDIGYSLLEGIVPMTYDEYLEGMNTLKDVTRIATAHKSFSDRYKEFTDDPSKVILNRLKIEDDKQQISNVKNRNNVANLVKNTSVGDLARGADNGKYDLNSILDLMKSLNSTEDGGEQTTPYQEQVDKVKEAQELQQTRTDLINGILQDKTLSNELIDGAINIVNAAYERADNIKDFLDLDMEAYNEARNLRLSNEGSPEDIALKMDETRNIIQLKITEFALKQKASLNLPNSSDATVLPENKGTVGTKDPQDVIETEQERMVREQLRKAQEEAAASRKENKLLTWDYLVKQALGVLEIPPILLGNVLNIKSLVDDALDTNLSLALLTSLLQDDDSFNRVNNATRGSFLSSILLYYTNSLSALKNQLNNVAKEQSNRQEERGPVSPNIENYTKTSSPNTNEELPFDYGKKLYLAPSLERTLPDRNGEYENYEDSLYAKSKYPKSILNRMHIIRKFLEERNAFDNVDNGAVKVGDELSLVVFPELVDLTGELIILMQTLNGLIVGDLPSKLYHTTKDYAGLIDLIDKIQSAYTEWHEEHPDETFIYKDFHPRVTLNLIGKVIYTNTYKPLNEVFGNKLQLGLCLTEGNQPVMIYDGGRTKKSRTARDNTVMLPVNPIAGMPFILIETSDPNRKYYPVPFRMARYDGNTDTYLGRAIQSRVKDILNKEGGNSIDLKYLLLDLIALLDLYLEYEGDNITFRVKKQGSTEFDTIIPNKPLSTENLYNDIIESLKESPYLISKKYINDTYEFYEEGTPIKISYNKMIGEIATVNIKEGATHTKGDWFITTPATGKASTLRSQRINPNSRPTVENFEFNGSLYTLIRSTANGVDLYQVKDAADNIIKDDNIRAYAFGVYKGYDMTRPYNVPWSVTTDINGEKLPTSTYNPKTNKYITSRSANIIDLSTLEDANQAVAAIRGAQGKNFSGLPDNPFNRGRRSGGVPLVVQLAIAEANRQSRINGGAKIGAILENPFVDTPFEGEDLGAVELDSINAVIQDTINEIKGGKNKLPPKEVSPWLYWREQFAEKQRNAPKPTAIDLAIMNAVLDNRRTRKLTDVEDLLVKFYKELNNSNEAAEENSLPKSTEQLLEVPSYKVGDTLKGKGRIWKVVSTKDNNIELRELVSDFKIQFSSMQDLQSLNFTMASQEDVLQALLEVEEEATKPITKEEVLDVMQQLSPVIQLVMNNFSGYFEGGGRTITDDFPNFNETLAAKFENYLFGLGEFTEDDAVEFLNEANRRRESKDTGIVEPNPELDELSPLELKEKATSLGLLGNKKKQDAWNALSLEALIALVLNPIKARTQITLLSTAYNGKEFKLAMLGNPDSVEAFIYGKPLYSKASSSSIESLWNEQKELSWLAKALPQFNTKDRLLIVETLKTLDGEEAYGQFWNNIITIAKNAVRGTVYHEAFHGVVNSLLTEQEYTDLFKAGMEQYKDLSMEDVEEKLAEDFRRYMKLQEIPVLGNIVKIFRKLKHFILKLLGNELYINKLFYDISNGKFDNRELKNSNILRYSQDLVIKFQSVLDSTVNNPVIYPINSNKLKDSIIKQNKAYGKIKDNLEAAYNVTIKAYRDDNTNKWIISSVRSKVPKYLRAKYVIEMDLIRNEAIANGDIVLKQDGTFDYALAPNGRKSNLNELLWLQVRTKAFKNWFGDWINDPASASKVVDENGEPLVVYRIDNEKFSTFDRKYIGTNLEPYFGKGFYFTPSFDYASAFPGTYIRDFFLRASNIYSINDNQNPLLTTLENSDNSVNWVKEKGKELELVVFNPNQIKSATDNEGDFALSNDNINDWTENDKYQQKIDNFMFEFLPEEDKLFILDRVGLEEYNQMSLNMKEVLLHCK